MKRKYERGRLEQMGRVFELEDGDGIEITKRTTFFYHVCCDCKLKHKVEIERWKDNIILKFFRCEKL